MVDILEGLTLADYHFLVQLIESDVNLTDNQGLRARLNEFKTSGSDEARIRLCEKLEQEIRYLGSSDVAYLFRFVSGQTPGVTFREIIRDCAKALHVRIPIVQTDREQLEALVQEYVSAEFGRMAPSEQQRMLEDLGVEKEQAQSFVKKSAGIFAVPVLIQTFGMIVVDGLIKRVIFGTIARFIGKQLSARLFSLLASRFPWWIRWIGPAAWTLSIGWTAVDLQGPALRKTVPVTLYLGLCMYRARNNQAVPID